MGYKKMSDLKISNLYKSFPGMDRPAVNNVSLDIKSGGLIAFLGPSGCGKTTILKMITGLFQPDSGDIILDNSLTYYQLQLKNEAL